MPFPRRFDIIGKTMGDIAEQVKKVAIPGQYKPKTRRIMPPEPTKTKRSKK